MTNLTPIKVKIGLRSNGHADHPDWTKLQIVKDSGLGENYKGGVGGWFYDKTSGHQDDTLGSPLGFQWGMLFVFPEFATQALVEFPDIVFELTEAEAQDFYDNKAMVKMPQNKINTDELVGLKAEKDLKVGLSQDTTDIDARILKALDPNDDTPGVIKTKNKTFTDMKSNYGINIQK